MLGYDSIGFVLVVTGSEPTNLGKVVRSARRALTELLPTFVTQFKCVAKSKLVTQPKLVT